MFAFNPGNEDRSGEILGNAAVGAANTTAQANVGLVNDIGGALMGLASSYAGNRAMKAEAEGYDKIGEILGGSMFKDNPAVGGYLADLRKQKDPQAKIAGYNALFGLAGPMSNAMMAQRNAGTTEFAERQGMLDGRNALQPCHADVMSELTKVFFLIDDVGIEDVIQGRTLAKRGSLDHFFQVCKIIAASTACGGYQ